MKHQYSGDVNDFWKYALRTFAAGGLTTRVCWMLTPDLSSNGDGHKIGYPLVNSSFIRSSGVSDSYTGLASARLHINLDLAFVVALQFVHSPPSMCPG